MWYIEDGHKKDHRFDEEMYEDLERIEEKDV
jgi:hypothetical protein